MYPGTDLLVLPATRVPVPVVGECDGCCSWTCPATPAYNDNKRQQTRVRHWGRQRAQRPGGERNSPSWLHSGRGSGRGKPVTTGGKGKSTEEVLGRGQRERAGTCAVGRDREKREDELPRFGGTVGTCLGERERQQRAVEVLAATRTHSLFPSLPPRTAPQCTPSWCWLCGWADARRGEAGWVSRVFRRFDELFSLGTRNLRFQFARAEHSQRQRFALGRESVEGGATVRRQTAAAAAQTSYCMHY